MLVAQPITAGLRKTLVRATAHALACGDEDKAAALVRWAVSRGLMVAAAVAGLGALVLASGIAGHLLPPALLGGLVVLVIQPVPRILAGALQGRGRVVASQLPDNIVTPMVFLLLIGATTATLGRSAISVQLILGLFSAALVIEAAAALALQGSARARPTAPRLSSPRRVLAKSAFAFGAIAGVQAVNSNLDVVMLTWIDTSATAGVYRATAAVSDFVVFGLTAMNATILHHIAHLHATGRQAEMQAIVTRAARWVTAFAALVALGLLLWGDDVLQQLYGDAFGGGYPALAILAAGQFLNAACGPVALILNMTGNERTTLIGLAISLVVNIALNLFLIPAHGMIGAAMATAVALLVWNTILSVALRRRLGIGSTALGR